MGGEHSIWGLMYSLLFFLKKDKKEEERKHTQQSDANV